ncbi:MAG: hypothetical protein QXE96_06295 [Candidatus Caldarchaeum sp.]|jgi:hypothetical protein
MESTDLEKSLFPTGHQVFDRIVYFRHGMTVLVTDETFSEAKTFLRTLLKNHQQSLVELVSTRYPQTDPKQVPVPIEALQDLSINVNQKRRAEKNRIFIHSYLPELLIRHNGDEVLKLLEMWQKDVANSGNLEFYLLPRNTFADFERKAKAIVDAAIEIQVIKENNQFLYYFTPIRSCSPAHHLKNIRYEIKEDQLLIEWEGAMLDRFPADLITMEKIREKLEKDEDRIVLKMGNINPVNFNVEDYVLLTSLDNLPLSTVKLLYPDRLPDLLDKITQWILAGILKTEEAESSKYYPRRNQLKLKNKLLLRAPTSIALMLVSLSRGFLGKRVRTVPLDAHLAVLEAMKNVVELIASERPELRREVKQATRYFGEQSARKTALEHIMRLEGTPYTVFQLEHVPSLIALSLKVGWDLDVMFISKSRESWFFEVKKCHLCEGITDREPFCDKFVSSVVSGVLSVCLKRRFECFEVSCKAMGHKSCSFKAYKI